MALAELAFIGRNEVVHFLGPPGSARGTMRAFSAADFFQWGARYAGSLFFPHN